MHASSAGDLSLYPVKRRQSLILSYGSGESSAFINTPARWKEIVTPQNRPDVMLCDSLMVAIETGGHFLINDGSNKPRSWDRRTKQNGR